MNHFDANMEVLARTDPRLQRRLFWPARQDHIRLQESMLWYEYRRSWFPLKDHGETVDREKPVLFMGVGSGDAVFRCLQAPGDSRVVVWDRDPNLFHILFARFDLKEALLEHRLKLSLSGDLFSLNQDEDWEVVIAHGFERIYRLEVMWIQGKRPEQRALLFEGELFVDDVADTLLGEGYGVYPLDPTLVSLEQLAFDVRRFNPQFMFAINYRKGYAEFSESVGIPLLVWEIDPTTDRLAPLVRRSSSTWIFTYREAHVQEYRQAGFDNASQRLLAANPRTRHPVVLDAPLMAKYGAPLSFVGASMKTQAMDYHKAFVDGFVQGGLERGWVTGNLQQILQEQRRDFSTFVIKDAFERRFGDKLDAWEKCASPHDPAQLAAEISACEKRITYVTSLIPMGIRVWGDQGWADLPGLGEGFRGRAEHGEELTRIYNGSLVNLDIGRVYQEDIITMRVFDVLACAGFLLTEAHDVISRVFVVGRDLECYTDLQDLREKVAYYTQHPEKAKQIGQRGYEKVVENHTFRQRLQSMLREARLQKPVLGESKD